MAIDKKYGAKEVADVIVLDTVTKKPILFLDSLKMSALENTSKQVYARGGKGNAKLLGWDLDRDSTLKLQDALLSEKTLSLLTGNDIKDGVTQVHKRDVLVAVAGATTGKTKVTLSKAPSTVLGADPMVVMKATDLTEVTPDGTSAGVDVVFTDADVPVGTEVIVYYSVDTTATARTFTISANKFPKFVKIIGLTVLRNAETGEDEPFEIVIPKAKISPNFNMTFQADGDPSVFDINLEVYRPAKSQDMVQLIKYVD